MVGIGPVQPAELEVRDRPPLVVADGHEGGQEPAAPVLSPVPGLLGLDAADEDGVGVRSNVGAFPREGVVDEVAAAVPVQPLVLGEHVASGAVAAEVDVEQSVERDGVATGLGVDPPGEEFVEGVQAIDARAGRSPETSASWPRFLPWEQASLADR